MTADLAPGQPVVFRNATVLTMDDAHHVLHGADVLISGERIEAEAGARVAGGRVAISCGFSSGQYFATQFAHCFGISPTEFRLSNMCASAERSASHNTWPG